MVDALGGVEHRPVLYQEIIHALKPATGKRFVDGTVGAGGHAWGLLKHSAPDGLLLGMDVDPQALEVARRRLAEFGPRAILVKASYARLSEQLATLGWQQVDGVLLDLGVSSLQLESAERGFSFLKDGPLDMRFDPQRTVTAADLVNTLSEDELSRLFWEYGEEPQARAIAKAVVRARPVRTTSQLAEIVQLAVGQAGRPRQSRQGLRIHPATRVFQALRIVVNGELEALQEALPQAVQALVPGGRLAVIAFHSLEDRLVKQFLRRESRDCLCPPRQPVCTCGHRATLVEITRHPVRPTTEEVAHNPRARSARLRVAERRP